MSNIDEPKHIVGSIPTVDCADSFRTFEIYRNYVIHEDALIGERLQRLLTIQGLLFAAEAALLPKFGDLLIDLSTGSTQTTKTHGPLFLYGIFVIIIPVTGVLSAHFVLPALSAAREAIKNLNSEWKKLWQTEAKRCKIPELVGGGAPSADINGHKHILHIAKWFRAAWSLFFIVTIIAILYFYLHSKGFVN